MSEETSVQEVDLGIHSWERGGLINFYTRRVWGWRHTGTLKLFLSLRGHLPPTRNFSLSLQVSPTGTQFNLFLGCLSHSLLTF